MTLKSAFCCFSLAVLSSAPVYASTIFNFSFTGNASVTGDPDTPFSGSGTFTATEVGTSNKYKVTAITGTTDGQKITKLLPASGYAFNDNFLFYNPGDLEATTDNSGISYQLANGVDVNIFLSTTGTGAQQEFGFPGMLVSQDQVGPNTVTIASTPEPSSFVLLGTGLLGVMGVARRTMSGSRMR